MSSSIGGMLQREVIDLTDDSPPGSPTVSVTLQDQNSTFLQAGNVVSNVRPDSAESSRKMQLICSVCKSEIAEDEMEGHINSIHLDYYPYRCCVPDCGFTFSSLKGLRAHEQYGAVKHKQSELRNNVNSEKAKLHDKYFQESRSFSQHLEKSMESTKTVDVSANSPVYSPSLRVNSFEAHIPKICQNFANPSSADITAAVISISQNFASQNESHESIASQMTGEKMIKVEREAIPDEISSNHAESTTLPVNPRNQESPKTFELSTNSPVYSTSPRVNSSEAPIPEISQNIANPLSSVNFKAAAGISISQNFSSHLTGEKTIKKEPEAISEEISSSHAESATLTVNPRNQVSSVITTPVISSVIEDAKFSRESATDSRKICNDRDKTKSNVKSGCKRQTKELRGLLDLGPLSKFSRPQRSHAEKRETNAAKNDDLCNLCETVIEARHNLHILKHLANDINVYRFICNRSGCKSAFHYPRGIYKHLEDVHSKQRRYCQIGRDYDDKLGEILDEFGEMEKRCFKPGKCAATMENIGFPFSIQNQKYYVAKQTETDAERNVLELAEESLDNRNQYQNAMQECAMCTTENLIPRDNIEDHALDHMLKDGNPRFLCTLGVCDFKTARWHSLQIHAANIHSDCISPSENGEKFDDRISKIRGEMLLVKFRCFGKNSSDSLATSNEQINTSRELSDQKDHSAIMKTGARCNKCDCLVELKSLRAHVYQHLVAMGSPKYTCTCSTVCGYRTHLLEVMKKHLRMKHHKSPQLGKNYLDNELKLKTKTDELMKQLFAENIVKAFNYHFRKISSGIKPLENDVPAINSDKSEDGVKNHYDHLKQLCKLCGQICTSHCIRHIQRHLAMDMNIYRFKCKFPYCDEGFVIKNGAPAKHMKNVHGRDSFCDNVEDTMGSILSEFGEMESRCFKPGVCHQWMKLLGFRYSNKQGYHATIEKMSSKSALKSDTIGKSIYLKVQTKGSVMVCGRCNCRVCIEAVDDHILQHLKDMANNFSWFSVTEEGIKQFKAQYFTTKETNQEIMKPTSHLTKDGYESIKCNRCGKNIVKNAQRPHAFRHLSVDQGKHKHLCKIKGCGKGFSRRDHIHRHLERDHGDFSGSEGKHSYVDNEKQLARDVKEMVHKLFSKK